MLTLIRMVMSFVDPRDHGRLIGLMVMMLGIALLEMGNLGLVVVLLKILDSPGQIKAMLFPPFSDWSNDVLAATATAAFGIFFLLKTVAISAMVYISNHTVAKMMAEFQARVFRHQVYRPYLTYLVSSSTTTLQTTVMNSYRGFEALRVLLNTLIEAVLMAATGVLLLLVQPVATLVCGTLLIVLALAFHRLMGPLFQRFGTELVRTEGHLMAISTQAYHSIRTLKIHHVEPHFEKRFFNAALRDCAVRARSFTVQNVQRLSLEAIVIVAFVIAVLVILFKQGTLQGVMPILGLFALASLRLMPSFNRILQYIADLRQRETPIRVLHADLSKFRNEPTETHQDQARPFTFERALKFESVSFSYPGSDRPALSDINVSVAVGESVGLVGTSGAGKSSLAEIILGLLPPTSGRLTLDGIDISRDVAAWQASLGYVPQQVYLLDDTVRRNVAFGIADAEIDDERVWSALVGAHLTDVIRSLPNGLDAGLGEDGQRLSGGQRQRIGIARALYRDPAVLVFDEATSALDNETEREVTAAIDTLMERKTLIVIAHRLSTVRRCTKIVFLRDGRVVDSGSFDDLLARCAEFRDFAATSAVPSESAA